MTFLMQLIFLLVVAAIFTTIALFVARGFVLMYKQWDKRSATISVGILLCVPVLLHLLFQFVVLITGGIGGTAPI